MRRRCEDPHELDEALDLLLVSFQQVGALDLPPVIFGRMADSKHFLLGLVNVCSCLGEAIGQ